MIYSNKLKNILQQCPIYWIVSSIVAIKYSNIINYLTPEYKKIVKDAYNIFMSGKSTDLSVYIPTKVYEDYVRYAYNITEPKIEEYVSDLMKNSKYGFAVIFIYILLKNGLRSSYSVNLSSPDNILVNNNTFLIDTYTLNPFIDFDLETDVNNAKHLLFILRQLQKYYNLRGYSFDSGILGFISTKRNVNHVVAFSVSRGKYYICESKNNKREIIYSTNRKLSSIFIDYDFLSQIYTLLTPITTLRD